MVAFLDAPSFPEILMVLFVSLLVFGGRLPEVARKLGKGISSLKKSAESLKKEIQKEVELPPDVPKKK